MPAKNTIEYDAEAAERGWRETQSLRAALPKTPLPRIDLQDVAILGVSIASILSESAVRERFELLHRDLFDHDLLDRIGTASWALWYANMNRLTAESTEDGAKLSAATLNRALEVKTRMMRVTEYVLADHPKDGHEVAAIRAGSGHGDLASDLGRLARLYKTHRAALKENGGGYYRSSDAKLARELSAAILTELGQSHDPAAAAKDDAARAFAVLEQAYRRVQGFAHLIIEDGEARFPSLWSVRPPTKGPRAAADPADDDDDDEPVTGGGGAP